MAADTDPFALLGLPRRFDLPRDQIEQAYLSRVMAAHPDAGGDPTDPGVADLNEARRDLLDPETRANVLLRLLGGPVREDDRSLPDGFLAEMMEARERLEAAQAGNDQGEVERWRAWAESARDEQIRAAAAALADVAVRPPANPVERASRLKAVRTRLNAWRYIERLLEALHETD